MASDKIHQSDDALREGAPPRSQTGGNDNARLQMADMLRERREALGLSLQEVEVLTRVRRKYLEAFEQAAYDVLPSRAFSLGYVKAYARALGLDEEMLAEMFKREIGAPATRLQAPTGASMHTVKPNYAPIVLAAACLVVAIVGWNVVQRKPLSDASNEQMPLSEMALPEAQGPAFVQTTRKKAAPKDQDIPSLYYTAGLEEGFAAIDAERHGGRLPVEETPSFQQRKAFNPRGAIYGAPPEQSVVTLQARKSVELIVRNADDTIQFAQYLGAGEAFRVPRDAGDGMVVTVSDAAAFEVYYDGELAGGLEATQMPVPRLNARAQAMAEALDSGAMTAPAGSAAAPSAVTSPRPRTPSGPIPYAATRPAQTAPQSLTPQGSSPPE